MTIAQYTALTGITVSTAQEPIVKANIARAKTILESMLGYTLSQSDAVQNGYSELGIAPTDFVLPTDDSVLLPPDEVVIAYRLYPYHRDDVFMMVDPFNVINAVKLVYVRGGETPNGITLKTFELNEYRVNVGKGGVKKSLEKVDDCWWGWWESCNCDDLDHVQLAVDADWLFYDCLPKDLRYIWADMVTYYSSPNRDLKSQTLGSHSWTKDKITQPEDRPESIAILKKYAGPFGSLTRTLTL